jgi:hypothetical protein
MIEKKSPYVLALAVLLSFLMIVPADNWAAPQRAG